MILFQGDSITEAGRGKATNQLGTGYVKIIAESIDPSKKLQFLNRGIGGNKIRDLKYRWKSDCLDLEPNVVSILIGINDVVGRYLWSKPTATRSFEEDYRTILEQASDVLGAKLVLMNPFIICKTKTQKIQKNLLKEKINVIELLSKEFNASLIPLDKIFEEETKILAPTLLSTDGIHPTQIGHTLIAQSWLKMANLST